MERKFEQELYIENITKEADPVSLGCRERNMLHDFTFFRQPSNLSGSPLHILFSSHIAVNVTIGMALFHQVNGPFGVVDRFILVL